MATPDEAGHHRGTVGGESGDARSGSPTWFANRPVRLLSISVSYDRTNPDIVYAGTGDVSSFFGQGGTAIGLLRARMRATWKVLPAAIEGSDPAIVANGQTVLVATSTDPDGIYRSTDGGQSFKAVHRVTGTNLAGPIGAVTDLVAPPRVSLTDRNPEFIVYAGVPRTGIYRSDDGGVTWNLSNTGLQLVDNIDQNGNGTRDEAGEDIAVSQRIELAIHDNLTNNTSAVYAGLIVNGSLLTVYRTNTFPQSELSLSRRRLRSRRHCHRTAKSHQPAGSHVFVGRRSKQLVRLL